MKKILIAAVIAMVALSGCTSRADKAAEMAGSFLTCFFNMDYDGASAFCTDEIASMLRDTLTTNEYPSEEIREKVAEASRNTEFKVLSSEVEEETGDIVVSYQVIPYGASKNAAIPHRMRIARIDGDLKIKALE